MVHDPKKVFFYYIKKVRFINKIRLSKEELRIINSCFLDRCEICSKDLKNELFIVIVNEFIGYQERSWYTEKEIKKDTYDQGYCLKCSVDKLYQYQKELEKKRDRLEKKQDQLNKDLKKNKELIKMLEKFNEKRKIRGVKDDKK